MELLVLLGTIVTLDILAYRFGYDSRESHAVGHYERALDAVRGGNMDLYHSELAEMQRDLSKDEWRLY
jgi:hypothetical protein